MSSSNRTLLEIFPWQDTSLGPMDGWAPEMRSAIQMIMTCGVPASTCWGADQIHIYNDEFRQIAGDEHPVSFGAPLSAGRPPVAHPPEDDENNRRTRAVAHDFNNLLTVILGNLDVLEERLDDDANLKLLAKTVRAAEDAGALTRQLLDRSPAMRQPAPVPQQLHGARDARATELRVQALERHAREQISRGVPLADIVQGICAAMEQVLTGARATVAMVVDGGTHLEACDGVNALEGWLRARGKVPVGEGHLSSATAVFRREPVFSTDIAQDPLWSAYQDIAAEHGLAACWSLPVLDAAGKPVAGFDVYFATPKTPDAVQIALLHRMAELIASAISQSGACDQTEAGEQRYRTLFDFLPIAIWEQDITGILAMLDGLKQAGVTDLEAWLDDNPDFIGRALLSIRVLDTNRAARTLHQIRDSTPEALTQALARNLAEPRFRDALRNILVAVWKGEKTIRVNSSIVRNDGARADLLVQILLPDTDNGSLLMTELDVTEQRRAEERFRHVAHASSDYIFDRDFETETTWVNDGATWHPDLPAGPCVVPRAAWVDSVHAEDSDRILQGVEEAIRNGAENWEGEYRLRMRDGDFVPVRERASILRNDAGVPVRMLGNIVDLSEQKALEAQLRQAQRLDAIGQLTGGIAHDFNNLLTVILGNAEMLVEALPADRIPDRPATRLAATMAGQIVSASERAAELTQRLLAFARKQPLAPGVHDAAAMVEGMRVLIERSITPTVTLEMDLAQDASRVHVDQAMFESALLNLCLNARDAMPEGGCLRIEAGPVSRPEGTDSDGAGFVRVAVSDTGTGMDQETLVRVFEPFFTTKPPGEGNGLGLSMVYGFVRQSGGDVVIDSKPGVGTTVAMLLPAHAQMPLDETPGTGPARVQTEFEGRILVVEDHDQVRQYTCMLLRSLGFEVVDEPRAASALERLRAGEQYDLLFSDVIMPGDMGGRQLAQTVLAEWPELPVLLVSGYSDDMTALKTPLAPHIAFLRKPFRKHDLAERLARLLPGP